VFKYRKILVPLDGSELSERAVAPASIIANAMTARVIFLQVIEPLPLNIDPFQPVIAKEQDKARQYLKSVQSRISLLPVDSEFAIDSGSVAAEAILNCALQNDVDLVVMSCQGRSGFNRRKRGSVAEKVLRGVSCDTLIIRAQANVDLFSRNRILVPLDGSPLAEMSLEPAIAIAKAVSAELVFLRVTKLVYGTVGPVITLKKRHYAVEKRKRIGAETYLQQVQASLSEQTVPCKTVVVTSDTVAETIIDLASEQKVDLIVMSTHGRSGLGRWIRGSVAEEVLRGANCATLVIREQESIHKEDLVRMKGV
jgi:nucleotide-binding universal stress UspA family protein